MTRIIIFTIAVVFFSCDQKSKETYSSSSNNDDSTNIFHYDSLDYYYSPDRNDYKLSLLYEDRNLNIKDSLARDIYFGEAPDKLSMDFVLKNLDSIGFIHKNIEKKDFPFVDSSILPVRGNDSIFAACLHEFRDLLIFNYKGKPIGMLKVCFHCSWTRMLMNDYYESFGRGLKYNLLEETIGKYRNKGDRKY